MSEYEWVKCSDELPELKDDSVIVYFAKQDTVDMVHIEDYFKDITCGKDEDRNQLYTKWYLSVGVTHWHPMPEKPVSTSGECPEIFPCTLESLDNLNIRK